VLSLAELWSGDMAARIVDGRKVLLVRIDDVVFAYEDRCAHQAMPMSEGSLDGTTLTCSAHHYSYDVRTGEGINPRAARLRPFAVKIEGDDVFVDVTATGAGTEAPR
jgi:toluene monooxygenase system ferredoxin subunit